MSVIEEKCKHFPPVKMKFCRKYNFHSKTGLLSLGTKMIKISTRPAYHGEWLKQEKYFTCFIISPRLGCKSTHQGNRTSGIFTHCFYFYFKESVKFNLFH